MRIFSVRPTQFEIDHAPQVLTGLLDLKTYHALPDSPFWRSMEFRHDLNATRFSHWHPNLSRMIEEADFYRDLARSTVPRPGCLPTTPIVCGPHHPVQAVPEPSSGHLLAIGLIIYALKRVVFG